MKILKWAFSLSVLVLPLGFGGCGFFQSAGEKAAGEDSAPLYRSFREIPGITAEEIAAVENLRSRHSAFVYGTLFSTESFPGEGGIGGYAALFCRWLSELFDIPFNPVIYDWQDLAGGLASGDIDFTGELSPTEDRRGRYLMSEPIARRTVRMIYLPGADPSPARTPRQTPRYGFFQGANTYDLVVPHIEEEFEALFAGDLNVVYRMLQDGSLDAFFAESAIEAGFDPYGEVMAEDFLPLTPSPVSFSTRKPELAPFISALNKALAGEDAARYLAGLYSRGYGDYRRHKFSQRLAEPERRFIRERINSGEPVFFAAEYDNFPISFYNEHDRAWQGIAIDILREAGQISGLNFQPANAKPENWAALLSRLEEGRAALITELIPSRERQGRFIWPRRPYYTDYYTFLSRNSRDFIDINQIPYSRVGIIPQTAPAEIFQEWFPNHENVGEYPNTMAAFAALRTGKIDLLMSTHHMLLNVSNYLERPDFKANLVLYRSYSSYFGFNRNEALLCSVIDKAQSLIDTERIAGTWTRRVFNYRAQTAWTLAACFGALAALFLSALVFVLVKRRPPAGNAPGGRRSEKPLDASGGASG
jgi:ABC-type amino acid transport substrate-binding protein